MTTPSQIAEGDALLTIRRSTVREEAAVIQIQLPGLIHRLMNQPMYQPDPKQTNGL
jgi:hypothetical protein